jgi:polyribonucleotide nucleotidyltransferase
VADLAALGRAHAAGLSGGVRREVVVVHVFQRGETQIMGVTTLNMLKLEQQIDSLSPVKSKR